MTWCKGKSWCNGRNCGESWCFSYSCDWTLIFHWRQMFKIKRFVNYEDYHWVFHWSLTSIHHYFIWSYFKWNGEYLENSYSVFFGRKIQKEFFWSEFGWIRLKLALGNACKVDLLFWYSILTNVIPLVIVLNYQCSFCMPKEKKEK